MQGLGVLEAQESLKKDSSSTAVLITIQHQADRGEATVT